MIHTRFLTEMQEVKKLLRDDHWKKLQSLLSCKARNRIATSQHNRLFLGALSWMEFATAVDDNGPCPPPQRPRANQATARLAYPNIAHNTLIRSAGRRRGEGRVSAS